MIDVAKKESGRVRYYLHTHKCTSLTTLPALGGMDDAAAGVAGQVSSYARAVAQVACLFPGTRRASEAARMLWHIYVYALLEHTFKRHSSAIASHTTCSVKCMQPSAGTANGRWE